MTARRLVVAALAAIWLLPIALASGVALHVAFDHGHDAESHGGEEYAEALPALLEHGHAHTGGEGDHQHRVLPATSVALRSVASPPAIAHLATPGSDLGSTCAPNDGIVSYAPPSRAAGAPLLALLTTLRI